MGPNVPLPHLIGLRDFWLSGTVHGNDLFLVVPVQSVCCAPPWLLLKPESSAGLWEQVQISRNLTLTTSTAWQPSSTACRTSLARRASCQACRCARLTASCLAVSASFWVLGMKASGLISRNTLLACKRALPLFQKNGIGNKIFLCEILISQFLFFKPLSSAVVQCTCRPSMNEPEILANHNLQNRS